MTANTNLQSIFTGSESPKKDNRTQKGIFLLIGRLPVREAFQQGRFLGLYGGERDSLNG